MEEDKSGSTLEQLATSAGHSITDRQLVKDDIYAIRSTTSQWIANENIQVTSRLAVQVSQVVTVRQKR